MTLPILSLTRGLILNLALQDFVVWNGYDFLRGIAECFKRGWLGFWHAPNCNLACSFMQTRRLRLDIALARLPAIGFPILRSSVCREVAHSPCGNPRFEWADSSPWLLPLLERGNARFRRVVLFGCRTAST